MKRQYMGFIMMLALALACCRSQQAREERGFPLDEGGRILVGVAWPFSVKKDLYRNGVEMAIEEINAKGGLLGYPLEAQFADDRGEVTQGKAVAQTFGENPEMIAVLGHYDSFISLPASVTYAYYNLLMLSPGSTDPKLTEQGFPKVFRTIPSDAYIGAQLAESAVKLGLKTMVIICEKSSYGRQLANAIEFRSEELGLTIVDRLSYDPSIREYRLMFNRLTLMDLDGAFFAGTGQDASAIMSEARHKNLNMPFLGGNGLDTRLLFEEGHQAVEGTFILSVFHVDNPNPYVQHFRARFKNAYQTEPDAWAAQGYDAVQLLAHAIRAAQSTQPAPIAEALRKMDSWYGVTGQHRFDENGNVIEKPMVMKIARNGRLEFYAHYP